MDLPMPMRLYLEKFNKQIYWKIGKVYDMLYPLKYAVEYNIDPQIVNYYVKYEVGKGQIIHVKIIDKEANPQCVYVSEGHKLEDPFEESVINKIQIKNNEGFVLYKDKSEMVELISGSYFSSYKPELDKYLTKFYEVKI
jgi:hypothetical protein